MILEKTFAIKKEKLDLNFYAQQRVAEEHKRILCPLFSNIYLNSANGFIGINASGKTSVLKVILFVLEMINNEPINHIETRDILGDEKEVKLNTYFFSRKRKEICRLETIITSYKSKSEGASYNIVSESLWTKNVGEVTTRKAMLDFDEKDKKLLIHLKFEGKEEILLNNSVELNSYLLSGTVKGMTAYSLP
jgi:hypothetical protein